MGNVTFIHIPAQYRRVKPVCTDQRKEDIWFAAVWNALSPHIAAALIQLVNGYLRSDLYYETLRKSIDACVTGQPRQHFCKRVFQVSDPDSGMAILSPALCDYTLMQLPLVLIKSDRANCVVFRYFGAEREYVGDLRSTLTYMLTDKSGVRSSKLPRNSGMCYRGKGVRVFVHPPSAKASDASYPDDVLIWMEEARVRLPLSRCLLTTIPISLRQKKKKRKRSELEQLQDGT